MRMLLLLTAFSLACFSVWANEGSTVVQPGVFSYQAPVGWHVQDSPRSKYKVALADPINGFAPNINVVIENAAISLSQYVKGSIQMIEGSPLFSDVKVLSQEDFTTSAGLKGRKVVLTDKMGAKLQMQQTFYFLDGGSNNKLVITTSCGREDGVTDAPLFDAAIESFTLE